MATTYGRQISTLVQHRTERSHVSSERTLRAIGRVGQAVSLAVERFVTVGETIADDNPEIRQDMYDACKDARAAGSSIERLCEITVTDPLGYDGPLADRSAMVRAARGLLSSVTRVLLLADIVVVKQLLLAKDKVAKSLGRLESVANFTEFVKAFSVFGAEMVELAHVTGDRQNDLKDERRRAQMAAARQVLERSTMMLLTSSKTCLRHPECGDSRENRDTVFCQMRRAMDLIHYVVKDGIMNATSERRRSVDWDTERSTASSSLRMFSRLMERSRPRFEAAIASTSSSSAAKPSSSDISSSRDGIRDEMTNGRKELSRSNSQRDRPANQHTKTRNYLSLDRELQTYTSKNDAINAEMSILSPQTREELMAALDKVVEKTQDFTDSAYTTHEHRENILLLCDRVKLELNQCLRMAINMEQFPSSSFDIDTAVDSVLTATQDLSNQLFMAVADQTSDLGRVIKHGIDMVHSLRTIALNQELEKLQECADRFHDYIDHILDVCKLLRHIALSETLHVQAKFTEINLRIYGPQVITACRALSMHPNSKIAKENLEVFADMWQWLASDVNAISKEIIEMVQALTKPDRTEYLSLPRPGKHGTTSKPLKPSQLDQEEQEKIAKSGLEMKMLTNEMDAETEKWNGESDENNDIVKRAKNMSSMAFSMYQFTKGEGTLRTTQDLFTQAEYFAEEANRLYKVVRQFSYQVPAGDSKKDLLDHLDKVPTYVQTLQFTVKEPTVGKAATFLKVDHVIKETKNLMNVINKVVTTCFDCANKYKLDFSGLSGRTGGSGGSRDDEGGTGAADSKGSSTSTEATGRLNKSSKPSNVVRDAPKTTRIQLGKYFTR
ncbi:alpha-catulin isoform X2 [Bradysia coprophila]|uniref:alpha-catulin isoform X2 n=1 Tax=Bradysia coprophila TaxID=38358 RepID=UPI00187D858E|nr:alpha-catulin isoform X2 [Bradysia coprophila]